MTREIRTCGIPFVLAVLAQTACVSEHAAESFDVAEQAMQSSAKTPVEVSSLAYNASGTAFQMTISMPRGLYKAGLHNDWSLSIDLVYEDGAGTQSVSSESAIDLLKPLVTPIGDIPPGFIELPLEIALPGGFAESHIFPEANLGNVDGLHCGACAGRELTFLLTVTVPCELEPRTPLPEHPRFFLGGRPVDFDLVSSGIDEAGATVLEFESLPVEVEPGDYWIAAFEQVDFDAYRFAFDDPTGAVYAESVLCAQRERPLALVEAVPVGRLQLSDVTPDRIHISGSPFVTAYALSAVYSNVLPNAALERPARPCAEPPCDDGSEGDACESESECQTGLACVDGSCRLVGPP